MHKKTPQAIAVGLVPKKPKDIDTVKEERKLLQYENIVTSGIVLLQEFRHQLSSDRATLVELGNEFGANVQVELWKEKTIVYEECRKVINKLDLIKKELLLVRPSTGL